LLADKKAGEPKPVRAVPAAKNSETSARLSHNPSEKVNIFLKDFVGEKEIKYSKGQGPEAPLFLSLYRHRGGPAEYTASESTLIVINDMLRKSLSKVCRTKTYRGIRQNPISFLISML
jgi:hypothetical protein